MKFSTPEVAWHNRDPVYSVDIQPCLQKGERGEADWYRVATSGADATIIIWKIFQPTADQRPRIGQDNVLSLLTRHEKSVNVVRFVPSGEEMLASADVDGTIIIWRRGEAERITTTIIEQRKKNSSLIASSPDKNGKSVSQEVNGCTDANGSHGSPFDQNSEYSENWNQHKVLRGHLEDVVDICWSADGLFLVSGSVDNESIIWDVTKGAKVHMLSGHKNWVQGVSYDPLNDFVATISADRSLRIFSAQTKKVMYRVEKASLVHGDDTIKTKLFYDYTMQSFTRRLSFSPAGEMLLVPSGVLEFPKPEAKSQNSGVEVIEIDDEDSTPTAAATLAPEVEMNYINACHLFLRNNLQKPFAYLPTQDKFCHAVKFCPTRFRLHEGEENCFPFPYRIVFAIATQNSVLIYDTQHMRPFAFVSDIHYARLSDLAWSKDGRLLIVSSTDGFCTLISFEEHALGQVYEGDPYVFPTASSTVEVEKEEKEIVTRSPAPEPVVKIPKIGVFFTPISKEARMERMQNELNSLKRKEQTPSAKVDPVQESVSPETKKPRILFTNVQ